MLLHEQGVQRTTLAEVAEHADVPAGNVYYYFKTKDELVAAVIDGYVQQARQLLKSLDVTAPRKPASRRSSAPGRRSTTTWPATGARSAASAPN